MRLTNMAWVIVACAAIAACSSSSNTDSNGTTSGSGSTTAGAGGAATTAGTGGAGTTAGAGGAATTGAGGTTAGSGGSGTTSGSGGGSSTTGGGEGGAAALCANPPANDAPKISDQYDAAAMPAMGTATGGTIESGTYFMTAITDYESAPKSGNHKDTMLIDVPGATMAVNEVNGGAQKPPIAGTFTTSGHELVFQLVCPASTSATYEYTYAAGTFTIYDYASKSVSVWTKQ